MADFVLGGDVSTDDLHYAAGIVDGEGTIFISELSARGKRKSPQFRCSVAVGMCDPLVPMLFAGWFGGSLHTYPGRKPGQRAITYWRANNRAAEAFCRLISPYLRLKRQQAELVLAFYDDPRFVFKQRQSIPLDEIEQKREYVTSSHALNVRGVDRGGQ